MNAIDLALNDAMTRIKDVFFESGMAGDKYLKLSTELLQGVTGAEQLLLTQSGTSALEMAALLIDIEPGDEVILPSYTFVSTANAFVLRGAVPVFVDIKPDTLNINEDLIEAAITKKTKAIVPVHYAGVGCDMEKICAIAKAHGVFVIEDAAQCIATSHKGRHLGTWGDLGILSFHHTKNITSGLGGAILINNKRFIDRAKVIWQKGTNREAFLQGQIDKYTWCDIGSSFCLNEVAASILYAQLKHIDEIIAHRHKLWQAYHALLSDFDHLGITRPVETVDHSAHIYYVLLDSSASRDALMRHLRANQVSAALHYPPLHLSALGAARGRAMGELPVTVSIASRLLRLPLENTMTMSDVALLSPLLASYHQAVEASAS